MDVIADAPTLLKKLGAYSYASTTDVELADKLQGMPSNDVDRIFMAVELLNTFADRRGEDGTLLQAQLAAFIDLQKWVIPGKEGRVEKLMNSAKKAMGEKVKHKEEDDPEPIMAYRDDGVNWRDPDGSKAAAKAKEELAKTAPPLTPDEEESAGLPKATPLVTKDQ